MFTDKTIALAEEFMRIQDELDNSIKEDLKDVNGSLCKIDRINVWVDDIGIHGTPVTLKQVRDAIGVPIYEYDQTTNAVHLRYKIGTADAVTVFAGKDM